MAPIIVQSKVSLQTDKIDEKAVDGLLGTSDSLAYILEEIEKHDHNNEKWFGLAGTPAAETHRADRITLLPEPFQADAGNDTWGSWLQIIGSSDTPVVAGQAKYDFNKIIIASHERNNAIYAVQIASGESAGLAAKITAEDFTETMFISPSAPGGQNEPLTLIDHRESAGVKEWVRIWCKGQDTGTLDFYISLHEYSG